jgi:hypothetical protein
MHPIMSINIVGFYNVTGSSGLALASSVEFLRETGSLASRTPNSRYVDEVCDEDKLNKSSYAAPDFGRAFWWGGIALDITLNGAANMDNKIFVR